LEENKKEMEFTRQWVKGFGWENTCYLPSDFQEVEYIATNDVDGDIFIANFDSGTTVVLKGKNNGR